MESFLIDEEFVDDDILMDLVDQDIEDDEKIESYAGPRAKEEAKEKLIPLMMAPVIWIKVFSNYLMRKAKKRHGRTRNFK